MDSLPPEHPNSHRTTIRRLFQEIWTESEFAYVSDLIAPTLTYHIRGQAFRQAPEALTQIVSRWHTAFGDLVFQVEDVVVEGDRAAARLVYTGAHRGEWKGIPPTGRTVEVHEMMFFRFEGDKIAEVWEVTDEHALRQQLLEARR